MYSAFRVSLELHSSITVCGELAAVVNNAPVKPVCINNELNPPFLLLIGGSFS